MLQLTTPESLISRYAADIAFVTEQEPATALYDFIDQLTLAAERLEKCGCVGAEEIGPAAYLADAQHAQPGPEQQALLKQAANRLRVVDDAVDEYRDMV